MKELFEMVNFEKSQQMTKKNVQNYLSCKEGLDWVYLLAIFWSYFILITGGGGVGGG